MAWSKGFYFSFIFSLDADSIFNLKEIADGCKEFVVGIPSEALAKRFFPGTEYNPQKISDCLRELKFVSDVILIGDSDLDFAALHKKIAFDAYYYGCEYGRYFELDKKYAEEHKVSMLPLVPAARRVSGAVDSLGFVLDNIYYNKKIILFGTGAYFDAYMNTYAAKHKPAYAVDSSPEKIGQIKSGIEIKSVDSIKNEVAGNILVVFCAKNYAGMKQALLSYGDYDYRPMLYDNNLSLLEEYAVYINNKNSSAAFPKYYLRDHQSKTYKLGFALSSLAHAEEECANQMRALADQCENFVIGIPSDYVMARIFGGGMNGYNSESVAAWWKSLGFVDDVLVLDKLDLGYQAVYEKIHFDVCFYGSDYGKQFEQDSKFFAEKNVSIVNIAPNKRIIHGQGDSLILALQNVRKDQKVVLFGTGLYFDLFVQNYSAYHNIAYAVDNDESKWNKKKSGINVKNPEVLKQENSDDVLVVICAKNYSEIKNQIKSYGDFDTRTLIYNNQTALLEEYYIGCKSEEKYIRQAQSGLMLLLKEFDRVCKKYNLKYYIICGSLIGVIRHKGFIPWDDDMDLAMTWQDYKKLMKVASKEWKDSDFHLLHFSNLGNGAFLDFMPRLVYMKEYFPTKVYDKVTGKCDPKFEHRMFLDIYPMLNASSNEKKHIFYMNFMKGVYNLCMGHRVSVNYDDYARMPKKTVRLMKFINTCGKFFPIKFLTWWYMKLADYAKHEKCDEYFMPSCAITCIERKFKKEFFNVGTYLPFNDMQVMVPEKYSELLEAMGYHGYMNFPPLHIRKPSHYFNSDIEIW